MNEALLTYDGGTLLLGGEIPGRVPPAFQWDARVGQFRAPAVARRGIVRFFAKHHLPLRDESSAARGLAVELRATYTPRDYQTEAFRAWTRADGCGTVVLPTGAGKTCIALAAIAHVGRSTLIVAPTLDLMSQWYALLTDMFRDEAGILGGGYHEVRDLTVTTYDSAYIYAGLYGNRFDLLIFDEVHHLPAPNYRQIPRLSTAWQRLGLTATYERQDGAHAALEELIGPVVYRKEVRDLAGEFLAEFEIVRLHTELTDEEAARYAGCAEVYLGYLKRAGLQPFAGGWEEFIRRSAFDAEARRALLAKTEMTRLIAGSERKLEVLDSLLKQHQGDKVLIFTEQNELVYRISREFLVPALTHQTKTRERKWILDGFKGDLFRAIVTSRVLNEGIDVPSAKIAIILSGSASPREHLQRLGRILRKDPARRLAILYEVVTSATAEVSVSSRRRITNAHP